MAARHRWRIIAILLAAAAILVVAALISHGRAQANQAPLLRQARIIIPDLPPETPSLRLALLSDIHVGNASTPPQRLERVIATVTAAKPDAIVIAGDFVNGDEIGDPAARPELLVKPLSRLKAPLGVFATLGNHDHWTGADAVRSALEKAGIRVLANSAARMGPFVVAGVDDSTSGHAKAGLAFVEAQALGGIPIVVTHAPFTERFIPRPTPLMLHGHTHCGQTVLHLAQWAIYPTELLRGRSYPKAMRCGLGRVRGMVTVASGGIGTSSVPMRFGAPPDWWMITLAPPSADEVKGPRRDPQNASAGGR